RLKQVLQLWSDDLLPGRVPETWHQFLARVERSRFDIQRAGGRRVLVVSSGGPIAVIAQQVLLARAATAIALNMQIRNSSVCQIIFNYSTMSLVSFNSLPQLERADRHEFITYALSKSGFPLHHECQSSIRCRSTHTLSDSARAGIPRAIVR